MHHRYTPPPDPHALTFTAYTAAFKAFSLAREPFTLGVQSGPRLDYLVQEKAEAPFVAFLKELGLRPPAHHGPTSPLPGGPVRMVPSHPYAALEEAVVRESGMEPDTARRRVDAALAALALAPFPAERVFNTLPCPYARWTEDGRWLLCDWDADGHPVPGWHEAMEILHGGSFAQADDRCVNLGEWR